MAEFCKKCYIEKLAMSQYEIDHIVLSENNDFCEGCGEYGLYVDYISKWDKEDKSR